MTEKRPIDLPEGWQKDILNLYRNGANDAEIKAWIAEKRGYCSNTFWTSAFELNDEFNEIIRRGRQLSEAWWLKIARENVGNNKFNTPLWIRNMMHRHGWKDVPKTWEKNPRKEVDLSKLTDEELIQWKELNSKAHVEPEHPGN